MIKIEFTVEEVNTILAILQKQPYEVVAFLIEKIKTEGDKQFAEQQKRQK